MFLVLSSLALDAGVICVYLLICVLNSNFCLSLSLRYLGLGVLLLSILLSFMVNVVISG